MVRQYELNWNLILEQMSGFVLVLISPSCRTNITFACLLMDWLDLLLENGCLTGVGVPDHKCATCHICTALHSQNCLVLDVLPWSWRFYPIYRARTPIQCTHEHIRCSPMRGVGHNAWAPKGCEGQSLVFSFYFICICVFSILVVEYFCIFVFLATLVALHLTPVSKRVSEWLIHSFGLA